MIQLNPPVSFKGIAAGTAVIYEKQKLQDYNPSPDHKEERRRFERALADVKSELTCNAGHNEVFAAHLEMLSDPVLEETVLDFIDRGYSANDAVNEAECTICAMFLDIDDEYLKSRSDDVRDIFAGISKALCGNSRAHFELPEDSVVIAEELLPSDTLSMDLGKVAGIITETGSQTSHVGIIACNWGIPAVLGFAGCLDKIRTGDNVVIDGNRSLVLVNPEKDVFEQYRMLASGEDLVDRDPAVTRAGRRVSVMCNAGSIQEVKNAVERGADGIGLFRSEFVFMQDEESGEPSEDRQCDIYRSAAMLCSGKVLIIRLLDIGGDKKPSYVAFGKEDNPFLGLRGVRFLLANPEILKRQLRAILRASAFAEGVVRIMIPMVTDLKEVSAVKDMLDISMSELDKEGILYDCNIKVGIMVETPAAVFMSGILAVNVDFFSIGTNDLTQYIMAADRSLPSVGHLCDYSNPAVRKAVMEVCRSASEAGIPVGMCGEMASDIGQTGFLLEAGLDSFSVGCSVLKNVKSNIRKY